MEIKIYIQEHSSVDCIILQLFKLDDLVDICSCVEKKTIANLINNVPSENDVYFVWFGLVWF